MRSAGLLLLLLNTNLEKQSKSKNSFPYPIQSTRSFMLPYSGVRSKTPSEGYSVFLSYESSMRKTAIEHPRVPISNASLVEAKGLPPLARKEVQVLK